jgi:hypothetical protein
MGTRRKIEFAKADHRRRVQEGVWMQMKTEEDR